MDISPVVAQQSWYQPKAPVTCLADELLLDVFSRLKTQDLVSVSHVCQRFYTVLENNGVWEALFKRDFPRSTASPERSFFSNYVRNDAAWKRPPPFLDMAESRHYACYPVAHDNLIIAGDWSTRIKMWNKKTGVLQHTLAGHPGCDGLSFLYTHDGLLFSHAYQDYGSENSVKVWSLQGTLIHTLDCHRSFKVGGGRFWGVSTDDAGAIKVWDKTDGSLICSIAERVLSFVLDSNRLISGSFDGIIKVWDTNDYTLLSTLGAFQEGLFVEQLIVDQEFIFAAYSNGIIKKWNTIDASIIASIEPYVNEGHTAHISFLTIAGEVLLAERMGLFSGSFCAWNKNDLSLLYSEENYCYSGVLVEGNRLVLGLKSGIIQIRDIRTGNILLQLPGHPTIETDPPDSFNQDDSQESHQKMYKFIMDGNRLISYGSVSRVGYKRDTKIWNIDSGELLVTLEEESLVTLDKSSLVTICRDAGIRVWNFSPSPLGHD